MRDYTPVRLVALGESPEDTCFISFMTGASICVMELTYKGFQQWVMIIQCLWLIYSKHTICLKFAKLSG